MKQISGENSIKRHTRSTANIPNINITKGRIQRALNFHFKGERESRISEVLTTTYSIEFSMSIEEMIQSDFVVKVFCCAL
jgi:hypothetical protein